MNKLNQFAAASIVSGAVALNGCGAGNRNSAVEYKEGVLTVAADPVDTESSKQRTATRGQVLAMLGTGSEGRNADGSYVLCADMSSVYATPDVTDEDRNRISSRFESILMDQARALLVAEKCAQHFNVTVNQGCKGCVNYSTAQLTMSEGEVKDLNQARSAHAGNFVCIKTTVPSEIECKSKP